MLMPLHLWKYPRCWYLTRRLFGLRHTLLIADYSGEPVDHPDIPDLFGPFQDGTYPLHFQLN